MARASRTADETPVFQDEPPALTTLRGRNGWEEQVPAALAAAVTAWLGDRDLWSCRVRGNVLSAVSHPDAQKRRWELPAAS